MKAIRVKEFGGPEVMRLEEVADPKPVGAQVVVRIRAAGVNPVDAYMRAGTYPRKPVLPYTPGTDGAGTVESLGPDADAGRFKVGERVYLAGSLTGTYAELALCEGQFVFALPGHVTFAQGAAMHVPYATAFRALFQRAHAEAGETLLVHGASGGVGIAAVQLARAAGLRVIGTVGSERGRKLVLDEGAHAVLDHSAANHFEEALAATGGRGYDLILEMLANVNLGRDLGILAVHGRVSVVGSRGNAEITPRELISIHAALGAGLENKTLRPVIGQEIPLAEAGRAHSAIMAGGAYGKIVLIP